MIGRWGVQILPPAPIPKWKSPFPPQNPNRIAELFLSELISICQESLVS